MHSVLLRIIHQYVCVLMVMKEIQSYHVIQKENVSIPK